MKRLYSITIHGKHKTWSYLVWARPEHVADWREDGIEVDEVIATIPETINRMGLTKLWVFLQKIGLIPLGDSQEGAGYECLQRRLRRLLVHFRKNLFMEGVNVGSALIARSLYDEKGL